ncbi:hypothetical protein N657DRAFT_552744, partial [Parathielavia appendiculata]
SLSYEIDPGEPMVDCNLPELLVRDLEVSEDIFMLKDMTAGSPCAGLEALPSDLSDSLPAPIMRYRPSYQQDQQHQAEKLGASRPYPDSLVEDKEHQCAEPSDGINEFGPRDRRRDSSSVTSVEMGPHSIRTRQQSVATAATSVSGRCSSLFSHNTISQSPPGLSSCFSNSRGGSPPGTWYEDERESPPDEACCSVYTARISISDPHQPHLDLADDIIMSGLQKAPKDRELPPAPADSHFPKGCYATFSRPHTPASQALREKPRIIDIPPMAICPRPISSLHNVHHATETASSASEPRGTAPAARSGVGRQRQTSCSVNLQGDSDLSIHLLATANGRTVIDASAPPPISPTRRGQVLPHRPPRSPLAAAVDECDVSGDEEALSSRMDGERRTEARQPSLADLRRWVDASTETMALPQISMPYNPGMPPPGMPLPPEVMESLRVSISCFPETMLLTSSLSIETIRVYSRKVKHRAALDRQLQSTDTDSLYSNSHNTRPSKRWNMSWLSQSRRSSKLHQPQQSYDSLPWSTHSPFNPSPSSLTMERPRTTTLHLWTPIQTIFPTASPHLCDALYAHLLAYNYIRSLCPTPAPATTPVPPPTKGRSSNHQINHGSSSPSDDTARTLGIPHKAASLLGMDDPVSATAAYRQQQQAQGSGSASSRARMLLGRAAAGGGGRRQTSYRVLWDELFASSSGGSVSQNGPRNGFAGGGNQEFGGASAAMRELLAGLGRCVNSLVATMGKGAGGDQVLIDGDEMETDAEVDSLVEEGKRVGVVVLEGAEPVLVRALCEVVRCAEE